MIPVISLMVAKWGAKTRSEITWRRCGEQTSARGKGRGNDDAVQDGKYRCLDALKSRLKLTKTGTRTPCITPRVGVRITIRAARRAASKVSHFPSNFITYVPFARHAN